MSGQRSADSEGTAESVAAGCSIRELPRKRDIERLDSHLLCFTWGRGEDGYVCCIVVVVVVVVVIYNLLRYFAVVRSHL